jgi:hypothetical protein
VAITEMAGCVSKCMHPVALTSSSIPLGRTTVAIAHALADQSPRSDRSKKFDESLYFIPK